MEARLTVKLTKLDFEASQWFFHFIGKQVAYVYQSAKLKKDGTIEVRQETQALALFQVKPTWN